MMNCIIQGNPKRFKAFNADTAIKVKKSLINDGVG
jgi:hypothetical protein